MDSPWHFSAFLAPDGPGADSGHLPEIRRLRARILFDQGRRPAFRESDEQVQDLGAWHFTARRSGDGVHGPPLGYVRLLTPATAARYQSREFLGGAHYGEVLRAEGLSHRNVFEHSRLVVEHRARKLGLGLHLNALAVAAAHELGAAAMIGTSGTADGQDRFHARFGFHPVPGTRRYVEKYTEDVVILLHRAAEGAGEYTALVDDYRLVFRELMAEAEDQVRPVRPVSAVGAVGAVGSGSTGTGTSTGNLVAPGSRAGSGSVGHASPALLSGVSGTSDAAGPIGLSGLTGPTGVVGPTGLTGPTGLAGLAAQECPS